MDQALRNKLRNVVTKCRKLLEDAVAQVLQGQFGIYPSGKKDEVHVEDEARMGHLGDEDRACRQDLLDHFQHIIALGYKPKDALAQLVREVAFTHLNRLCAYKMMEAREVWVGGQRFREAVSRGLKSQGFLFYLAQHPEDEQRYNTGHQDVAYRHFLDWLGGTLSEEIGVLFSPTDPANRLYPPQRVLDEVLDLLNTGDIKAEEKDLQEAWPNIWREDEAIGWVYQYFTPKELRDQARKESAAPRNSYELAFRNQFFTPRYVVQFLTDNTLGRIWYEMRRGETKLTEQCSYMVRRPNEVFLAAGQEPPAEAEQRDDLSQEELLKQPVYIAHRPKKDPRELRVLDPACGSGHFLLYCFDLLLTIYEEAWADADVGLALQEEFKSWERLRREVPRLILAHNLHGIDIDLRATQIAALALWLRCQRAYKEMGLTKDRPKITRSNIVCAEPMPGEKEMLTEFVAELQPRVLGHLVEVVFDKMTLAAEAGSLLKIEEELRSEIASVRRQWVAEHERAVDRKGRTLLFSQADMDRAKTKTPQQQVLDFSEITDEQFWVEAEGRVLEALRNYASHAANGGKLRRQLFAKDAGHGFAFVDVCQKRFDVVLMNPPFGEASTSSKPYLETNYARSKHDVYSAFVERGLSLLANCGVHGAITNRTGFFLSTLQRWREDFLLSVARPTVFADLGFGVLDTALVETAAYCLQKSAVSAPTVFVRLLRTEAKQAVLATAIRSLATCTREQEVFLLDPKSFSQVPKSPFSYWVSDRLRRIFKQFPAFENVGGIVRVGDHPGDGFKFLRLFWEVPLTNKGRDWRPYQKGGEYSPYWFDIHLVVDWDASRQTYRDFFGRVGRSNERPSNYQFFFRRGLTWPRRSTSGFGLRILPQGCVFADKGPAILTSAGLEYATLGVMFSQVFQQLIEVSLAAGEETQSGTASRSYEVGLIQSLPWPSLSDMDVEYLTARVKVLVEGTRWKDTWSETTHSFVSPVAVSTSTLHEAALSLQRTKETRICDLLDVAADVESVVQRVFGVEGDRQIEMASHDARALTRLESRTVPPEFAASYSQNIHDTIRDELEEGGGNRQIAVKSYYVSRHLEILVQTLGMRPRQIAETASQLRLLPAGVIQEVAESFSSYTVGCVFGRWDVRFATGERQHPSLPDPFDLLPNCAPGMLHGADGLPATETPPEYPLRIDWDGILTDDPEHADDIVRRVRDVLELICRGRADAIEKEACEILGVKGLRDYFRKPGNGGFWADHISRYSKSRRKAPIYWLLQSAKKNYALWLYYHRLDKDILFKALVNYVEPKIRLEESRLASQRSQKGTGSNRKLDKEIEKQEDFLSELRDFEDKLRRAANLHLEPDLNDGVVLNIAPLWELVPWKEAKKYWEELMEGKYEWSSIGKQLRAKGLVR